MKRTAKYSIVLLATLCMFAVATQSAPLFAAGKPVTVDGPWRYTIGDSATYKDPAFDDSSWTVVPLVGNIKTQEKSYLWYRATVSVPQSLKGQHIYMDIGRGHSAYEVYIDGVYIGSNGLMPPKYMVRPQRSTVLLIPETLTQDGTISIALRVFCPLDICQITDPITLMDASLVRHHEFWRNFFGSEMYVIIAALCVVIGLYSLVQYILDHTYNYLFAYALSCFAVAVYFWDMGSNSMPFPYMFQRSFARWFLTVSVAFLWIFLRLFSKNTVPKLFIIASIAVCAAMGVGYIATGHSFLASSNLFTIGLLPIVLVIAYGVVISIQAIKTKKTEYIIVLTGFLLAISLAFHDIIMQVLGRMPFVWLQGYAFFILDIAVFASIAVKSASAQREVAVLAQRSNEQNERMSELFDKTRAISANVSSIAEELNNSVNTVSRASNTSMEQVSGIERAIAQQQSLLSSAGASFAKLMDAIKANSDDLEQGTRYISNTATNTARMIEGFANVGQGISGAAGFARTLDGLTAENQAGIVKLSEAMSEMKKKTSDILAVVQVLDDFSERTNLLAMNASIEAAHAGSAGSGFAVVANEIKNLASQSSAQANKIGENVREITNVIEQSVEMCSEVRKSLDKIRTEASATADHVQAAANEMLSQQEKGKAIEQEAASLAQMAERMRESATAQNSYSQEVKRGMAELTAAAQKVDAAASSITSATKSMSEDVQTLRAASDRTKATAIQLADMMK